MKRARSSRPLFAMEFCVIAAASVAGHGYGSRKRRPDPSAARRCDCGAERPVRRLYFELK